MAPVPLSPIDCGLPVALSVIEIEAVRAPPAVGVKVADTEQFAPAASVAGLAGQVFADMAKSPGLAPASTKPAKLIGLLPVFVIVTLCAALVVPLFRVAKVRLVELKLRVKVGACPVPLSATLCGLPVASSVKVTAALRVPVAEGVNVILTEQLAPAATARVVSQVLLTI
jgi:hypothetical protein